MTGQKMLTTELCGSLFEHYNQKGKEVKHCLGTSDPFWQSPLFYKNPEYHADFNDKASSVSVGAYVAMVVYEHDLHNAWKKAWRGVYWPGTHNLGKNDTASTFSIIREGLCLWEKADWTGDQDCWGLGEVDKNIISLHTYKMNDIPSRAFVSSGLTAKFWEHGNGVGKVHCVYGGAKGADVNLDNTPLKNKVTTVALSKGNNC